MAGFKKGKTRCTVINKQNGKRCKAFAPVGQTICLAHQDPDHGNPNMSAVGKLNKGNTHAMKLGLYSKRLLTEEEREIYDEVWNSMKAQHGLDGSTEEIILDQLCWSTAKLYIARAVGKEKAIRDYERRVGKRLQELNIRPDKGQLGEGKGGVQQAFLTVINKYSDNVLAEGGGKKQLPVPGTNTVIMDDGD